MSGRQPDAVVDSSVIVKWLMTEGEPHVSEARDLLRQHSEDKLILATVEHARLEVLNAVWARRPSEQVIVKAAIAFEAFHLELYPIDAALAAQAAALATNYKLTVYDAAFAALATVLECELLTADRQLAASGACRTRELGAAK